MEVDCWVRNETGAVVIVIVW